MAELSLTREAILAMEAGPELDAMVAERVMGLKRVGRGVGIAGMPGYYYINLNTQYDELSPPRYSTSIADAWAVVEKLRELGELEIVDYGSEGWGVYLELRRAPEGVNATALTVPLAVCTVALLSTL